MSTNSIEELIKRLKELEIRVAKLEGRKPEKVSKPITIESDKGYSGPTGGVRFLIDKEFFKDKQELATIKLKLSEEGYHYSRQAVHEALKTLSKQGGPLVSLKEGKRKTYVVRK